MAKTHNVGLVAGAAKFDPHHDYEILLSQIFIDWNWNTRIAASSSDPNSETEESGYDELVVSMAKDGQRDACVCRPNPYKGKGGHPGAKFDYMLVEGFNRVRARGDLAAGEHGVLLGQHGVTQAEADKLKTKEPTILTKVIPMTEAEARKRNLGENLQRSQLKAPDIAFGFAKLAETMPGASNKALGEAVGRSEPYVAKLRRIYESFKDVIVPADALWKGSASMPVTQAWRVTPTKALNEDMYKAAIADNMTPEDKLNAFLAASNIKKTVAEGESGKKKKKVGQKAFPNNAQIDAEEFGKLLGALIRTGAIDDANIADEHCEIIASKYAARLAKATPDERDSIAHACNQGIAEGKKRPKAAKATPEEVADTVAKAASRMRAEKKGGKAKANGRAHA